MLMFVINYIMTMRSMVTMSKWMVDNTPFDNVSETFIMVVARFMQ